MRSRLALGGLTLALLAAATLPAQAAPEPPTPARTSDATRLTQLVGREVAGLPSQIQQQRTVSALVELDGASAVQRQAGTDGLSRATARSQVQRGQAVVLPRLRAAGATVYGQLDTVLNAVQVRVKVADLDALAAVPGVRRVQVSQTVHVDNGAADSYTGVGDTWRSYGLTGKGQVIGVIDTGIDYTHADFAGLGTTAAFRANDGDVVERGSFPTVKVAGGYDFVGDDYDPDSEDASLQQPRPDRDPLDCNGHGTHVAGTAAGYGVTSAGKTYRSSYNGSTLAKKFDVAPGAAPLATLKAYRVFGCEGGATDDVIVAAIDRAVRDGVDIINLSLGGSWGTRTDAETRAVAAATKAGVLVVASAGNDGSSAYVVGSPGTADTALAVAAVDAGSASYRGFSISGAASGSGLLANTSTTSGPISGQLVDVGLGCSAADYSGVRGKIALAVRGSCDRTDRATLGQRAGALAVVMANTSEYLPPYEGSISGVTIPFVGVTAEEGDELLAAAGRTVTLTRATIRNPGYRGVAEFSSSGPRSGDSAGKPDVAAPGVLIRSAAVGTGHGSAVESGTSMASPHTAGIAALVRQANPKWSPARTKAALMSTALGSKVSGYDSRREGTGLVQPLRAARARAWVSTSSGLNSLTFGRNQLSDAYAETLSFRLTNASTKAVSYRLSTELSSRSRGARITITPSRVTAKAGTTVTIRVRLSLSADRVAALPGVEGNEAGELVSVNGVVKATPTAFRSGIVSLRMPFLSVPVPLSHVRPSSTVTATTDGWSDIVARNVGVHTGDADVFQWMLSDRAGDATSATTPDLTQLGVQSIVPPSGDSGDRLLVFAASQAAATSTQASRDTEIFLDTDQDGSADFATFALDEGLYLDGSPTGVPVAFTVDIATNQLVDAWPVSAPANGSTVQLPVLASSLGLTSSSPAFGIQAAAFSVVDGGSDRMSGTGRFNAFFPALSNGALLPVAPGASVSIESRVNTAQLGLQTSSGWLVVTQDDLGGAESDVVRLQTVGGAAVLRLGER